MNTSPLGPFYDKTLVGDYSLHRLRHPQLYCWGRSTTKQGLRGYKSRMYT